MSQFKPNYSNCFLHISIFVYINILNKLIKFFPVLANESNPDGACAAYW